MIDLGETLGSAIVHRPLQSCDVAHHIGRSLGALFGFFSQSMGGFRHFGRPLLDR
jgi:hypothetical protein